jgi:hypothetical protein
MHFRLFGSKPRLLLFVPRLFGGGIDLTPLSLSGTMIRHLYDLEIA